MWYIVTFVGGAAVGAGLYRRFGASAAAKIADIEAAVRNLELSVSTKLASIEQAVGIKK
jgi:hypothetical protein